VQASPACAMQPPATILLRSEILMRGVEADCGAVAVGRTSLVVALFVWRALSGSTMTPFPHPAHRTGRECPDPALDKTQPSHTARRAQGRQAVQSRKSRNGARVDKLSTWRRSDHWCLKRTTRRTPHSGVVVDRHVALRTGDSSSSPIAQRCGSTSPPAMWLAQVTPRGRSAHGHSSTCVDLMRSRWTVPADTPFGLAEYIQPKRWSRKSNSLPVTSDSCLCRDRELRWPHDRAQCPQALGGLPSAQITRRRRYGHDARAEASLAAALFIQHEPAMYR